MAAGLTLSETRNQLEDDLLQSVVQPGTQEDKRVRNQLSADLHSAATVSAPHVQVLISDQPITRQQLSQACRPSPEDLLRSKPSEFTSRATPGCGGTGATHRGRSADKRLRDAVVSPWSRTSEEGLENPVELERF